MRAAWDSIAPRYHDLPIIIQGRSLGTGLAARLARDVDPRLLVLVSPYTSLAALGKRQYPLVPAWLNRYPMRTDALIGDIQCPILLVHGTADRDVEDSSFLLFAAGFLEGPPVGEALLVGQSQQHSHLDVAGRADLALADQLPDAKDGALVHVEEGVHRVH